MAVFFRERFSTFLSIFALTGQLAAVLLSVPAAAAEPVSDEILAVHVGGELLRGPLPAGPAVSVLSSLELVKIIASPSGQIFFTGSAPLGPPAGGARATFNELMPDGSQRFIGPLLASSFPVDLAFDSRGRLFIVLRSSLPSGGVFHVLQQIDPTTGATLAGEPLDVDAIATAPDGLWAVQRGKLRKLDPDTYTFGPVVADFGSVRVLGLDRDSEGRFYYHQNCAFPCAELQVFDPETLVIAPAPLTLYGSPTELLSFAIIRRCQESATARCLQHGRYRAEIEYLAYDGAAGMAQAAPVRSADTAIFSFFDPDNWELMVKVLDGCAINDHVWVYAAASTDVGYVMTITDTQTGAQKVYSNALGHVAATVTDNLAFPCAP